MKRHIVLGTVVAASAIVGPALTWAGNPADFPMQQGEMAGTCFSGPFDPGNPSIVLDTAGFVVSVIDSRIPPVGANPVPVVDTNWLAPMFHNEFSVDEWNAGNLGQVFGLCLDNATPPNIYVTATSAYGNYASSPFPLGGFGPGGFAGVYQLDGTTGAITALTTTGSGGGANEIPNTGPALGNICFDGDHNQLFVTNHEDGKIYRLDLAGNILSTFDPFAPDNGAPGFAPLGERLWAVQYNASERRLYFSVWLRDDGRPGTSWPVAAGPAPLLPNNSIWAVGINAGTGDFFGTEMFEFTLPYFGPQQHSNPVADIAFSESNALIVAEKTMNGDYGFIDLSHSSRVLEFVGGTGSWAASPFDYYIGKTWNFALNAPANASGGVDYDCDANVWATGDTLHAGFPDLLYGFQRVPVGGNTPLTSTSTSYLIDADQDPFGAGKAFIGDVEFYRQCTLPSDCSVDPTATRCTGQCPVAGEQCNPKEILADAQGNFLEVSCCDCDPGGCHLQLDPLTFQFSCAGNCPTQGLNCTLVGKGNADGTISYSCECIDPTASSECAPITECNECVSGTCIERCSGPCPNPNEACVPETMSTTNPPTIDSCECVAIDDNPCRPVTLANGVVECEGVCDVPGEQCQLVVVDDAAGVPHYDCQPCPSDQRGACCYFDQPTGQFLCTEVSQQDCESIFFGTYYGDGSLCSSLPQPCETLTGACCYDVQPTGTACVVTTAADCDTQFLNGVYQGDGTTCVPDPCPPDDPTGACCTIDAAGNNVCVVTTQTDCLQNLSGIYQGDGSTCTPDPCQNPPDCECEADCPDRTPSYTDPAYMPVFTGEVAVATQLALAGTGEPVVVTVDIKNRATAPLNTNWAAATRYSHPSWIVENLGSIFGVCLDRRGHIYVAGTSCYFLDLIGIGGDLGTVYKIDATTGAITVFANISNPGNGGLGNIAYDGANDQFFVTNHFDGRIWRLDSTGACVGQFDHASGSITAACISELNPPGYVPLGERLWGVNVYNGRVYYSVWWEDQGRPSGTAANEIWSIALDGTGQFTGVSQLEITLPPVPGKNYSNPVADISFSSTACMLLAERGMSSDTSTAPHNARVLEYRLVGTSWTPSGINYEVGMIGSAPNRRNSAGGCDFDLEGRVYATGDALQLGPQTIYGIQSLPCFGGSVLNSALIDLNGNIINQDKTEIGDVEIACPEDCIKPPPRMVSWWPLDELSGFVAQDIAWGNNGVYTGTTSIPGKVDRARNFNGSGDLVRVPDHASLNFGQGDFSVDAWVRTTVGNAGVQVVTEKRQQPTRGWSLYLFNGNPGFQLADGTSFTNWNSGTNIADGNWHFVAVTVDRNDPNGLKIYVDNVVQSFDPTPHPGSVSTTSPLWIGARDPAFGQTFFNGDIDELELFSRALTAAEVDALFRADSAGKCKERCHVPWDKPFCIGQTVRSITMNICNEGTIPHNYNWFLAGNNECSVPGPTVFSPSAGSLTIPGGTCTPITFTVNRPPGLNPPLVSCYDIFVSNTDTGHFFKCRGSVQAINKWCAIVIDVDPILNVNLGLSRRVRFDIENISEPTGSLAYMIETMPSDPMGGTSIISLDGLPPGEPIVRTVKIPPGETGSVEVQASFAEFAPFRHEEVILMIDSDGDGTAENAAESIALQSVIPWGDLDRGGSIGPEDLDLFTQCIAGPGAPTSAACPVDVDADCDGDGDTDLEDFREYQIVFGAVTVSNP